MAETATPSSAANAPAAQTPAATLAPATPTAPAQATPAAQQQQPEPNKGTMADAYAALDKMAGEDTDSQQNGQQPPAPGLEDDQQQAGDQQPPPKPGDKPEKAATLRQTLDKTKGELSKVQSELAKRDNRIRELEETIKKPADDPEKKTLQERLEAREKRLREVEEELKFVDYSKSPEYEERYRKPFVDAYDAGRNKAASLKVDENGTPRQGTAQDFDSLMRITDDDTAAEFAAERFGNKASMVMYHRERVQELHRAGTNAIEDYRKNGSTRDQQRQEQLTKMRQELARTWETEIKTGIEKYPQWFKPAAGDEQAKTLLEKGFELADIAFGKEVKGADGKPVRLPPQELARLNAAIRNKAGAFDHVAHINGKLKDELRKLKKELKQYQDSEPRGGDGRGTRGTPLSTWDQVEADLAKRAR